MRATRIILAESIEIAKTKGFFKDISPLVGKLTAISKEIEQVEESLNKVLAESVPDEPFDPSTI
jgi:hypothetical protein